MTGRLITLEGGEGAGKSTQACAIANALEVKGHKILQTREPGGTSGAEQIRNLLLHHSGDSWDMRSEALLFAAARAEHVHKAIIPALATGTWVVCDRFVDSSRAYQTATGILTDQEILNLHRIGSADLWPDLTIVLDLPENIAQKRLEARDMGDADRIGGRDWEYHRRVRAFFHDITTSEPDRAILVDGNRPAEVITSEILTFIEELTV